MIALIYFTIAIISIYMFGDDLKSQVLLNVGEARTSDGKAFWEAYIVQISFSVVLTCHIPFIFTAGKEGLLIIIDELHRQSISNALWHKLQGNTHFSRVTEGQLPPNPELAIPGDTITFREVLKESQKLTESQKLKDSTVRFDTRASLKSIAMLNDIPVEEANRMAYKDMNAIYYVVATLTFFFIIVLGSILIKDIAIVFDFVGAISVSAIAFFFPATLYPIAIKKYNIERTWKVKRNICLSYGFIVLGIINLSLGIFVAILSIVNE